ncbi:MAG: zinc-binding dehydrogenase, partial [Myxococcota bacterium]
RFQAPFIPGFDGIGEIVALGKDVTGWRVGERVAAYTQTGSYAEYATANPALCFRWPKSRPWIEGVGVGTLITAYHALTLAGQLQSTHHVMIHSAAGGVGSLALQIASAYQCPTIVASLGHITSEREAFCRTQGATHVCTSPHANDLPTTLDRPQGWDRILNTLGGYTLQHDLKYLAPFGRVVTCGHSLGIAGEISSAQLHRHNQSVVGYSSGGYRKHDPKHFQIMGQDALNFFTQHQLSIPIYTTFPLAQASKAHTLMEQRQHCGKIVLRMHTEVNTSSNASCTTRATQQKDT